MTELSVLKRFFLFLIPSTVIFIALGGKISAEIVITSVLANGLITLVLALVSHNLPWAFAARAKALFTLTFAVLIVNVAIELVFFSTMSIRELVVFVTVGALVSGSWAMAISWLFPPKECRDGRIDASSLFGSRSILGWTWRLALCVLGYMFVYFVAGAIAYEFTEPYYTDPAYGLNLTVPSVTTVLTVQLVRGPIFVLSLIPFLAGTSLSRFRTALLGGVALFVLGGLAPLLSNTDWPGALRLYHTVEVLFQNFPVGILIGWLVGRSGSEMQKVSDHS